MKRLAVGGAWLLVGLATVVAGDIGYIEDFALSRDRAMALRQLVPGTEDYYYFHCLHYLNTEQYAKAEETTRPWLERFGQTPRLTEIQTRHALLTYNANPQRTLDYLRQRLGLTFDHQRVLPDETPNLPTALDANLIGRGALMARAFSLTRNTDFFEDRALDWLAGENLDAQRRRHLLARLTRPDVPNLVQLVHDDLRAPNSGGFGSLPIHRQLTLTQLDELIRLRRDLMDQSFHVQIRLIKLQPDADSDWRNDPAQTRAYFDRLWTFVRQLAPVHNSLKAHVLYHRLVLDRRQGTHDRTLFLEYLRLPRQQGYMARAMLENIDGQRTPANLNANFAGMTLLPPVGNDEPLVRSYLQHFLVNADSPREFEPYINDVYLRHLFAETKILNGLGEPEQWAAQLPPDLFQQLKERIDIDFAPTNKTHFTADEAVHLDVHVKNVGTLLVKVFEINTPYFYRTERREVSTDINLDGLVANSEQTHQYADPPLRRQARRFSFPELTKPGVYVIDFIGNGKSSRALIRKGRLRPLTTTSSAGLAVQVVDEAGRLVKDAALWLAGREYTADAQGVILIPFSNNPGRQPVVLRRGDFACLDYLTHPSETYELRAGIFVDRETLLAQRTAAVVVRPALFLNGRPADLGLLEDIKLTLRATDHDGVPTTSEVAGFKVFADRESVHEFRVPPRLATLQVTLSAKVKNLSQAKTQDLATTQEFALNGMDKTTKIEDLHLARMDGQYVIEVLGRTGESKADRPVELAIKHRDFREPVQVTLKSDAQGRIKLGPLVDIEQVRATGPEGTHHTWRLPLDAHSYRQVLHARVGETLVVPYVGTAATATRAEFALFEMRGEVIQSDRFDALTLRQGGLEIAKLPAGDFDLWLKQRGTRIRLRVVDGEAVAGYVLGKARHLELNPLQPTRIEQLAAEGEQVVIRLRDATPFTRVHVFADRYLPEYSAFDHLNAVRAAELGGLIPGSSESVYLTGRNIGDEYRYVLDRARHKKFPGNMLDRPSLLLNPWAVRTTETGEQTAEGGDAFGSTPAPRPSTEMRRPRPEAKEGLVPSQGIQPEVSTNLDFLADTAAVVPNLVPDKDGLIKLARKDLGPHAMIHVVVIDPIYTTYRSLNLAEVPAQVKDLRLLVGLAPDRHFTQQKQITVLPPKQPFVLADVVSSRFEAYDSLARVHSLFTTLSNDPKLAEFAFILNWPNLKEAEKRAHYSKHACHELSFFLAKKDPEFFRTVIKPYLVNKKDKTFLDHWLLDADLTAFAQPWAYAQLNTAERILLAQRLPDEPARTARHLNDLFRLLPPNLDRYQKLFDTAVLGSALSAGDPLGMEKAKSDQLEQLRKERAGQLGLPADAPTPAAPPMPPGAPGAGGLGGGGGAPGAAEPALRRMNEPRSGRGAVPQRDGAMKDAESREAQDDKTQNFYLQQEAKGKPAGIVTDQSGRARLEMQQLYRKVEPTQEWAENNYYKLLAQQQIGNLITVNRFWLDYAKHDGKTPFLSRNVAEASHNFAEMMLALAVLELPFTAGKPEVKYDGNRMTYTPAGPVIAFHEEVKPAAEAAAKTPVLVNQNFYRLDDRYREEDGERTDKFVTNEFVVHTVYGAHVVVTNPSPSRQKLAVLLQVPVGAVPLANGQYTKTVHLDLEPYRTHTLDYLFYFPAAGRFTHFPVHVAKNEALVAFAAPFVFNVVAKPSQLDTESWDYVSQRGTNEQVLAFLERANVEALDLDRIAFRMRDRAFFEKVLQLLQARHVYNHVLWSYGLHHNLVAPTRQYLEHTEQIINECGGPIDSPLLVIDPVAHRRFEHLEYKPLVNARAHALSARRQIVNDRLHQQYHHFMKVLSYRTRLTDDDWLAVTYYLLLQDRIDEALSAFGQVNPERVATRMQYDYCQAYLDIFSDVPTKARALAAKYADHPVDRWRQAFQAITELLDEVEGKAVKAQDAEDRERKQAELAAKEPTFDLKVEGRSIELTWRNLSAVRVNYYLMDVELLFSRNPFVQQSGGQFASIKPNLSQDVRLPADQTKQTLELPAELAKRNVLIEVSAAGKTQAQPYYANAMNVQVQENYGQLRVTDAANGKALSKVYVKCYARLANGQVKFHKDGYTDHRGRFDYASVSTPEPIPPQRFAILILSEDRGAQTREVNPPPR